MQVKYLDRTKNPFNMNMGEYLRIIETINNYMPYIERIKERVNGYYLVRIVLLDNIPKYWSSDLYKLVGENMDSK